MKVRQVRIQHYRSIEDTGWVTIEDGITTLLGKNESGKTSFLRAVASISDDSDYDDQIFNANTEGARSTPFPVVAVDIVPSTEADQAYLDKIGIRAPVRVVKNSEGVRKIENDGEFEGPSKRDCINRTQQLAEDAWQELNRLRTQNSGNYRNHFDQQLKNPLNQIRNADSEDQEYYQQRISSLLNQFENIPEQSDDITNAKQSFREKFETLDETWDDAIELDWEIDEILPSIVFHEEFDTISDSAPVSSIENNQNRTFRNLLKLTEIDVNEFKDADYFRQQQLRDAAEGVIEGEVNELWEQKTVEVALNFNENTFYVQLKDQELQRGGIGTSPPTTEDVDRKLVRPSSRSKGFQWFFSFYINLNAETSNDDDDRVILLDDPAVFLHPEGKKNWLAAIEDLSEEAQIVYSSHSPYLIRKEYPCRIRIVEDRDGKGTTITDEFVGADSMTLEPLREALGIGLGDSPFVSKHKILVEGVTDYRILQALANVMVEEFDMDILKRDDVTIMPTNGGNNMVQAAKWVASEAFSYVLLLDNDDKGKEVQRDIERQHQEVDPDRIILLSLDDEHQNYHIEVEDMFDTEFFIDCVNAAYSEQFKHFEPIELTADGDDWLLNDVEYKHRKITSKLNTALQEQDLHLTKTLVVDEVVDRLNSGEVGEEDIDAFKPVLGKIRGLI